MEKIRLFRRFFPLLCICLLFSLLAYPCASAAKADLPDALIPGGMAFGVKFYAKGAVVIGVTDVETASGLVSPARNAGLRTGDIITGAGGSEVEDADALLICVRGSGGQKLEIRYLRDGKENAVLVTPAADRSANEYRIGVWVRDSTAGIGTVTFVDAESKTFGGLGHGINDSATGQLMPLGKGVIVDVDITGVIKGRKNLPGELKGDFGKADRGTLYKNCEEGVFGYYEKLPESLGDPVPLGEPVKGKATVRACVTGEVRDYEIELEELYPDSGETKNFLIRVTDPALLAVTGGIVQGMSGSPILQNGRFVGAVTHVLVGDSTRGFGIRIRNMLANMQDPAKAGGS